MFAGLGESESNYGKLALGGDGAGVTAIEYSLIAALVAIVLITAIIFIGTSLSAKYNDVGMAISAAS